MKSFFDWLGMRFHNHNWEIYEVVPVNVYWDEGLWDDKRLKETYKKVVLQCKVCGEVKVKNLKHK